MKRKKQKTTLGNFYSPYDSRTKYTMNDWYEVYQSDPEKFLVINGRIYSKIIHRSEIYIYDAPTLLVSFESTDELRIGDVLIDEQDREFTIRSFEMIRFAGNVPAWCLKVSNIAVQGKDYFIGHYLTKKCCP